MKVTRRASLRRLGTVATCAAISLGAGACDSNQATPGDSDGPQLQISISPLTLNGATDACYTLTNYKTFANGTAAGNVVWTRSPVCASDYGVGSGATGDVQTTAIAYTGTCDASQATNDVALVLNGIYKNGQSPSSQDGGSGQALGPADFYNPCPASEPCVLTEPCNPNEDTFVSFDITVMRDGQKGFFDVSVQFEDIFCSAKFDCGYDNGDAIKHVIGLDGKPTDSAVLGFACTAGSSSPSHLYMSKLHLKCDTGIDQWIEPPMSGNLYDAPHNLSGVDYPTDAVFQAVTSLGQMTETSFTEYYWNVSLGFDLSRITNGQNCTLTARATAREGAFADIDLGTGVTPENAKYPYVDFVIPFGKTTGAVPQLTCAAGNGFQNKLNDTANNSGVNTVYTDVSHRECFSFEYPGTTTVGTVSDRASNTTCECANKVAILDSLTIDDTGIHYSPNNIPAGDVSLYCLEKVTGGFQIQNPSAGLLDARSFAQLSSVGQFYVYGLTSAAFSDGTTSLVFPKLTTATQTGASFEIQSTTLNSVSLPVYRSDRHLNVTDNTIGTVSMPAITSLSGYNGLNLSNNTNTSFIFSGMASIVSGSSGNFSNNTNVSISFPHLLHWQGTSYASINITGNSTDTLTLSTPELVDIKHFNNSSGAVIWTAPSLQTAQQITLSSSDTTSLTLPALTSVTYRLDVAYNNLLTSLALPALQQVGSNGTYISNNPLLATVDIGALRESTGQLYVGNNAALTTLSLPALTSIPNGLYVANNSALVSITAAALTASSYSIYINDNSALTSVAFSALASSNQLNVSNSPALTTLSFPALQTAGANNFASNGGLTSLSFPALTTLTSDLQIGQNASLTTVNLPVLATASNQLRVNDNNALTALTLPSLTSVGQLDVGNNTLLATLALPVLSSANYFYAQYNPALTSLTAPSLAAVANDFQANGNTSLACSQIALILGHVTVGNPPSYTSCVP